jgi:hypothetical protein
MHIKFEFGNRRGRYREELRVDGRTKSKQIFRETVCEDVNGTELDQNRVHWQVSVNMGMRFRTALNNCCI